MLLSLHSFYIFALKVTHFSFVLILKARHIHIQGLVQGVGFRPHVHRLAHRFGLNGWISNAEDGVYIQIEGDEKQIARFIESLKSRPPKASLIHALTVQDTEPEQLKDFTIRKSKNLSDRITRVCPDIAVCEECLADMQAQPHRIRYPFTNCTHCGPRFTIIRTLPYDRPGTTMDSFIMCETCQNEYESVHDRRFHAQPVACNQCGPEYQLLDYDKPKQPLLGTQTIVAECCRRIEKGEIIAIKGLGGFHLMCDATNPIAVSRLRQAKKRDRKPFAVMMRDIDAAARFLLISEKEEEALVSWRRPIVLLRQRHQSGAGNPSDKKTFRLAGDINPGCATIGAMLPYMPIHHLLFEHLSTPALVMTSGNLADEPIVIDNHKARDTFRGMAQALVVYNRDIHNRADDSVVFTANDRQRIIRRSRGYVPEPVMLNFPVDRILATGAELSHCFAVGRDREAILSQHIGDLKDPETYAFFTESIDRFCELFRVRPERIACDLHPDYLSTRFAREQSLPVIAVQHHHAHIAAGMAEFNLEEPVIGICWDGTGLGSDGNIWGGEFLYADLQTFERYAHFRYLPLPGGDKAAKQTWRTGVSLLYQAMGPDFLTLDLPFVDWVRKQQGFELLLQAVEKNLNTPLSSSVGRLFDAVAAISGVCTSNAFHAEAPIKLEALVSPSVGGHTMTSSVPGNGYAFGFDPNGEKLPQIIDTKPLVRELLSDLLDGQPVPAIAARFHNTLVAIIFAVAHEMKLRYNTKKVILTGGVFQNRYLLEQAEKQLEKDFTVYSPEIIPCNDAGIALGQMAVAARTRP